jgi:outer membrane cobalamin receptor
VSLVAAFAFLLASATPDSSVLTLDEVVVIADRVPHQVQDVSASVSVVTAAELERSLARTVTSALEALPGVFVQRTGQFGRTDIDIRGIGDRGCRVAVLVDGRPEKMSLYGCTVTHALPMSTVERIEVVRGPQSVLYGSDAIGGVINIITRRAELPLEYSVDADYGSFNTLHGNLSVGTRQKAFHALFTADKAMSDGHLPNSQYNGNDLSLRAGLELSPYALT